MRLQLSPHPKMTPFYLADPNYEWIEYIGSNELNIGWILGAPRLLFGTSLGPYASGGYATGVGCLDGTITVCRIANSMLFVDIATGIQDWNGNFDTVIGPIGNNQRAIFQPFRLADPEYLWRTYQDGLILDTGWGATQWGVAMLPPADQATAFKVAVAYNHIFAQYRDMPLTGMPTFSWPSALVPKSGAYGSQPAYIPDPVSVQIGREKPAPPAHLHARPGPLPDELPARRIAPWPRASVMINGDIQTRDLVFAVPTVNPNSGRGNFIALMDATGSEGATLLARWPKENESPFGSSGYEIVSRIPEVDHSTGLVAVPVSGNGQTSWFVIDFHDPVSPAVVHREDGLGSNGGLANGVLYGFRGSQLVAIEVVRGVQGNPGSCAMFTNDIITSVGIAMDWDVSLADELDFDRPQEQKKYTFWVNDDRNMNIGHIAKQDLENLSRMHIRIDSRLRNIEGATYTLRFASPDSNSGPAINIFKAADGTANYLRDEDAATDQTYSNPGHISHGELVPGLVPGPGDRLHALAGAEGFQIPAWLLPENGGIVPFLFEGKNAGNGKLMFTAKINDIPVAESFLDLILADITDFYDRFDIAEPVDETKTDNYKDKEHFRKKTLHEPNNLGSGPENMDYILFVHGWNMENQDKEEFAGRMFKRLYWQGYTGRMGSFQWPTLHWGIDLDHLVGDEPLIGFNQSEYRAYHSGMALKQRLEELKQLEEGGKNYNVHILAHSLGNVIVGQALRDFQTNNGKISSYIATQAAVSAQMFDENAPKLSQILPPSMPNLHGYYYDEATDGHKPYFDSVKDKVEPGKMFNYFNELDVAMTSWWVNNMLKPTTSHDSENEYWYVYNQIKEDENLDIYTPGDGVFFKNHLTLHPDTFIEMIAQKTLEISVPKDRFEIFAYGIKSRSNTLGAIGKNEEGKELVDGFTSFDLKAQPLSHGRLSHSRQFKSNIVDEWGYWDWVMKHFFGVENNYQNLAL